MSILSRLHEIIESDVAKLFGAAKKASLIAGQDVARLEADLAKAHARAVELAEQTRQHADAAAERARAAVHELEIEAKSAAERVAFHTAKLERTDPKL